jgi:hypothetical protein
MRSRFIYTEIFLLIVDAESEHVAEVGDTGRDVVPRQGGVVWVGLVIGLAEPKRVAVRVANLEDALLEEVHPFNRRGMTASPIQGRCGVAGLFRNRYERLVAGDASDGNLHGVVAWRERRDHDIHLHQAHKARGESCECHGGYGTTDGRGGEQLFP